MNSSRSTRGTTRTIVYSNLWAGIPRLLDEGAGSGEALLQELHVGGPAVGRRRRQPVIGHLGQDLGQHLPGQPRGQPLVDGGQVGGPLAVKDVLAQLREGRAA